MQQMIKGCSARAAADALRPSDALAVAIVKSNRNIQGRLKTTALREARLSDSPGPSAQVMATIPSPAQG